MRKWLPLLSVALGAFMLLIDVSIVNVALPAMTTALHASFSQLQRVIDIYALGLAALLLGLGSLSDLVGRKPVYVAGLAVFALGSLGAGLSDDTTTLIVARGVQGVGGAAMFATTIALLGSTYHGRDRAFAFGVWGAVNGAAAAAGPIIGGLLTQALSWRWVFFVNLPVSMFAIAVSVRVLPGECPDGGGRIDIPGVLAFMAAAGTLTAALTRVSENGWTSPITLGLLATGGAAAAAFVAIEARSRRPVLELALLRRPLFAGVLAAALLYSIAAFAYLTYESLWLQSVHGLSPVQTGLALTPLALSALIVSLAAGRWLHAVDARWRIAGGLALIGAGALAQAHLTSGSTWPALLPGLVLTGIGVGLATAALATAVLATVPVDRGGIASGALNTARQLGYVLGITALGLVCKAAIADRLNFFASTRAATGSSSAQSETGRGTGHMLVAVPRPARVGSRNHAWRGDVAEPHRGSISVRPVRRSGTPVAFIACIQRDGPGTICWHAATASGCDQHLNPIPWLVAGILLVAGAVLAQTRHAGWRSLAPGRAAFSSWTEAAVCRLPC
jgi:EmrB/QacA subfamily drug resistance transporter